MLKCIKALRTRALILFMTCGCRIGAISEMTMNDMIDMPDGCKELIIYRDRKYEYITYLTPEAVDEFNLYLEKRMADGERIDRNSPLFRNHYQLGMQKVQAASARSLGDVIARVQHGAGLRDPTTKKNGRI